MKESLVTAGIVLAILLYIPILVSVWMGKLKQSFAAWLLWTALDAIALVTSILQKGTYGLLITYCIGGVCVSISLALNKQCKWGRYEWRTLYMVIGCLLFWWLTDSWWALGASTLAVVIAGFPQIKDSWNEPDRMTALIYLGYTLANALVFFGAKSWAIGDWFYSGMVTVLCAAITAAALRKSKESVLV